MQTKNYRVIRGREKWIMLDEHKKPSSFGEIVYVPKYPETLWEFSPSSMPMPYWCNANDCTKVLATSEKTGRTFTLPIFIAPWDSQSGPPEDLVKVGFDRMPDMSYTKQGYRIFSSGATSFGYRKAVEKYAFTKEDMFAFEDFCTKWWTDLKAPVKTNEQLFEIFMNSKQYSVKVETKLVKLYCEKCGDGTDKQCDVPECTNQTPVVDSATGKIIILDWEEIKTKSK